MIKYKQTEVKLVGVYDGREKAWRHSRPHIDPNDPVLNDIEKVNLPVNGFAHYHFEITSSLLIRDLLYMIRPSNNWARSNRTTVINEDTLAYSAEYQSLIENSEVYKQHHKDSIDQNIQVDIRKAKFAYAVSTDYSFMCDARTLSNIINSLEDVPALKYFNDILKHELDVNGIKQVPHNDFNIFNKLKVSSNLGFVEEVEDVIVHCDPYSSDYTVVAQVTGNLNSQFIRQEFGVVKSTFINKIMRAQTLSELPQFQDEEYLSSITIDKDRLIKIVKTRSCWFAQFDRESRASWSRIVSKIIEKLNLDIKDCLICEGCADKCKWKAEQLCRLKAGNPEGSKGEVNMPCPILTGIPELYEMRGKKMESDSKLFRTWKTIMDKCEFKLTPEGNEFLNNVFKYGYAEPVDNEILSDFTKKLREKYDE